MSESMRACVCVRFSSLSISFLSVAPKKDCYRQLFWIVISTQIDFNVVTLIKSVNDLNCCVRRCMHVYWRPKDVNNHYFEWNYGVYFLIGIDGVFCFKTYEIQFIHSTWLSFIVNCHTAPDMLSDAPNANVFKREVICENQFDVENKYLKNVQKYICQNIQLLIVYIFVVGLKPKFPLNVATTVSQYDELNLIYLVKFSLCKRQTIIFHIHFVCWNVEMLKWKIQPNRWINVPLYECLNDFLIVHGKQKRMERIRMNQGKCFKCIATADE